MNEPGEPFGPSPHGHSWGDTPWREAARLPGSRQLGLAAKLLRELEWWRMEPHPEWVAGPWSKENRTGMYAAGIPGKLRVIFDPLEFGRHWSRGSTITRIEDGVTYEAFLFDPLSGDRLDAGTVEPDAEGRWTPPPYEVVHDWVIVLKRSE